MLHGNVRNLAIIAIAIASAIGLTTALSTAPALASSPSYKLIVNSGGTALDLTANGAGKPVTISSSGANDNWVFVNSTTWNGVKVSEIQHAGTGSCINNSSGVFVISSCTAGDTGELFWGDPTGSTTSGNPNYWYINVAASDAAGQRVFLTAASLTNGANNLVEEVGAGGRAAWNRKCSANC
jgi:hypothetical protein